MIRFGSMMDPPYTGRQRWTWWGILLRLLVGLPIIDRTYRSSNATFWRSAHSVQRHPNLNPCQHWPGWARLGWRVALVGIVIGLINYPMATVATLAASGVIVVGLLVLNWAHLRHRAEVCEPLFAALMAKMKITKVSSSDYARYLTVPRDYATGGDIVLRLPAEFDPTDKQALEMSRIVAKRLGIDVETEWDWERGRVVWRRLDAPTMVHFDHTMVGKQRLVPIGQDAHRQWQHIDLEHQTPHVLISAQTGWGKTVTLMLMVAWMVARGAVATICDPKRVGFLGFKGVPRITLHTHVEAMIKGIREYRESMERVYKAKENGEDTDDESRFPTRILVLDEIGSLVEMIKDHWKDQKGQGTPPAITNIKYILWQGRAARHFLFAGAQHANEDALISQDCKHQFGAKIAAGPQSMSSWRVMFGAIRKIRIPKRKGAAVFGAGDDPHQIQLTYVTEDEARAIATAVGRNSVSPDVPVSVPSPRPGQTQEAVPDTTQEQDNPTEPETEDQNEPENSDRIEGIAAAAAFLRMSEAAFAKARQRNPIDGEVKIKNLPTWSELDLLNWHSQKKIAGKRDPMKTP